LFLKKEGETRFFNEKKNSQLIPNYGVSIIPWKIHKKGNKIKNDVKCISISADVWRDGN
jgi:hypothetical protein